MSRKTGLLTGVFTYSILLLLSIFFYKERAVFMDVAYLLFFIITDSYFAIQHFRFDALFSQLFPLLGVKLGLSLNTLALLYSVSFVLLSAGTFLLIILVWKNTRVALSFLLYTLLITTHTFFWMPSELPQGVAFLFIFIALLDNAIQKGSLPESFPPLFALLIFTICFAHPLLLFPFLFLMLFYYLSYPHKRRIIVYATATYVIFFIIKRMFFKAPYDDGAIGLFFSNVVKLYPNYIDNLANKNLLKYFLHDYYFALILLVIVIGFYIKKRLYLKSLLVFGFFSGYIFMINCSYPGGADQFYIENQYMLFTVFMGVPFIYDVLPALNNRKVGVYLVFLIIFAGIVRIVITHRQYADRLDWYRHVLAATEHAPNKKIVIPEDAVPKDLLLMTWASAYEVWLLSTIETGNTRSVIIEENPGDLDDFLCGNKSFATRWRSFKYKDLDPRYFKFNDTSFYVRINEQIVPGKRQ